MSKYVTRLRRKAQIRFVLALAVFILTSIFVVWPQYRKMVEVKEKIVIVDEEISKSDAILEVERDKYRDLKKDYSVRAALDEKIILAILPDKSTETDIVRMLESEAIKLAGDDPESFSLEAVSFGSPQESQEADYSILPLGINIKGDEKKLMDFVRYLEKTGNTSIESSETATRLLEIESINLQLPEKSDDEIQISLSVNAFFMEELSE